MVAIAVFITVLLLVDVVWQRPWVVLVTPPARVGLESASAVARLFGALALFLFPAEGAGRRLRWVGAGFLVMALGGVAFGYVPPVLGMSPSLNTEIYGSLAVWTAAGMLFVIGLGPRDAPRFSRTAALLTLAASAALAAAVATSAARLPPLVANTTPALYAAHPGVFAPGLTVWDRILALIPFALAVAAAVGAARVRRRAAGTWLFPAMVLFAGAQLHHLFWPSTYSAVFTTADLLRFAFAGLVAVGGTVELRRIAAERTILLAAEQEESRRLTELNVLKANFSAMVAHELSSPLAALRGYADMLATGTLGAREQAQAVAAIQKESDLLSALVTDIRNTARIEREDFAVELRPVRLSQIVADAAAFARTLPGDHPLTSPFVVSGMVWADPERIGQVLRNLLGNAGKYTPPGTPIELLVSRGGDCVTVAVADSGPGIHPDDLRRIFEKFGRGRDTEGRKVPGAGLGLYLSKRIVQAHGSDLRVESSPGDGSTFSFELKVFA